LDDGDWRAGKFLAHTRLIASIFVIAAAWATAAVAEDSFLDGLGRAAGLVAPPTDPPDFVKASRPQGEPKAIPVFAAPSEPSSKVKSPTELKAMDADLERAAGPGRGTARPAHKAKRKAQP
jgi:hypothetical protein